MSVWRGRYTRLLVLLGMVKTILLSQQVRHTMKLSLLRESEFLSNASSGRPKLQFIFIVGLEGTGHHLHQRIVKASPAFHALRHGLADYPSAFKNLHATLSNKFNGTGLWNLPCDMNWNNDEKELQRRQLRVASVLKRIHSQILHNSKKILLRFPVNTLSIDKEDTSMYGMCSYPNWNGPCRAQQYPRLGWFYEACAMAGVDCRHVYLYRDPVDILYSTTIHRAFNRNLRQGLALYESMVTKALIPDLTLYANHSLGCVGFYSNEDWKSAMQSLWLWSNATKFSAAIDRIYKPPEHRSVNLSLLEGLSLETWQKGHDDLLDLCNHPSTDGIIRIE